MNQQDQLTLIERELRAAGWTVLADVAPQQLGLDIRVDTLDLVAKRTNPKPDAGGIEQLIVEIANRDRDAVDVDEFTGLPRKTPADIEEREALRRVEVISEALESDLSGRIGFQVRFFDVSVDQARARQILKISTTNEALRRELELAWVSLANATERAGGERGILTVVIWCRWLRILGVRFPARRHVELKTADIRTIQKDLYDAGIIETTPQQYFAVHQSITALIEGGDVDWRHLRELEADLHRVLNHVARQLGVESASEPAQPRSGAGTTLFDHVGALIALSAPDHQDALVNQLEVLKRTNGTPAYFQALFDFEDLLPDNADLVRSELPRLRSLARLIRN